MCTSLAKYKKGNTSHVRQKERLSPYEGKAEIVGLIPLLYNISKSYNIKDYL
jgi:hypothetical protein